MPKITQNTTQCTQLLLTLHHSTKINVVTSLAFIAIGLSIMNEVKAESTRLMQQWNDSHDADDQCDDWKNFIAEAIDNLSVFPFIKTICDNCNYCD